MATFNLRRFANADALKAIQVQHLRALLAPYQAYFASRGVSLDGAPVTGLKESSAAPDGAPMVAQDGLN